MLTNRNFLMGVAAGFVLMWAYHHVGLPGSRHGATRAAAG